MTVFVVLGEERAPGGYMCWVEDVGKTRSVARVLIGFAIAAGGYTERRVLLDGDMVGTGWSLQEHAEENSDRWEVKFTIHEREVHSA